MHILRLLHEQKFRVIEMELKQGLETRHESLWISGLPNLSGLLIRFQPLRGVAPKVCCVQSVLVQLVDTGSAVPQAQWMASFLK